MRDPEVSAICDAISVTSWISRMRIFADISSARVYNNIARAISGYPGRYPYATLGSPLCCGDAHGEEKMSETSVKIKK